MFRTTIAALAMTILLAAAPARARQSPAQAQVDAAIDRGTGFLLANYRDRLQRKNLGAEERVGQSALSLYTLLETGASKDDEVVRQLLTHLMFQRIQHTYDAACALLAVSAYDVIDNRRWIEELARQLIAWQTEHGDWAYPAGGNDLSNTQYAALGLWAAAKAGVTIEPQVWERLIGAVLGYQDEDGGFSYSPDGRGSSGSMTTAGIAVLAICEIELRLADRWPVALDQSVGAARKRGLDWLARRFSVTTNPRSGGWLYYYLYGLERLGALTGVAWLGEHDWYGEGAAYLVAEQGEDGAWQNGTDLSDTCFALLFLRRATLAEELKPRGPATGIGQVPQASEEPVRIASQGTGPVRISIDGWNKKLVRDLEWPGERGRGPRVARVEYLADERVIAVELGDAAHGCGGARFMIEHVFSGLDPQRVRARVFVRTQSGEQVLESGVLEVRCERAWPSWITELDVDLGPNLLAGSKTKTDATSVAKGKQAPFEHTFAAELAVDDHAHTPWLADEDDAKKTLTVSLQKSLPCDVIRVSPAVLPPLGSGFLSRTVELEIEINGKQVHKLALDPDPLHPMMLELDKLTAIKRLDVRVVSIAKSERCPLVGIGEIELFRRSRK